jgi:glycosyltransferase involved in cell wall biosynthesis
MKTPRFSFVIPTLNEEKFVPHLLSSLETQTVKHFEVIVVDGASQDGTVSVSRAYGHRLPLTVRLSPKRGVSAQRNMGAHLSKAEWLVFVDADSVLLSNFIERIEKFIDMKHPQFFTTWLKADSERPTDVMTGVYLNMFIEGTIVVKRPWAPGPMTIIRKDVFERVGGYDEEASYAEDHELSMTAQEQGIPFCVLREVLYIYSMRRFRLEGKLKAIERNLRSSLMIAINKKGPKTMPGFEGGGRIFEKQEQGSGKRISSVYDRKNKN